VVVPLTETKCVCEDQNVFVNVIDRARTRTTGTRVGHGVISWTRPIAQPTVDKANKDLVYNFIFASVFVDLRFPFVLFCD
jgi:hypothetical protein